MNLFKDDYSDFLSNEHSDIQTPLNDRVYNKVKEDLNPSSFFVFSKLLGVHSIVATLSLLVCPQFGLQVFRHQPDITEVLSIFGSFGCHLACGFIFMSASLLVAAFALSKEEVRKIRRNRLPVLVPLTVLSLGLFMCVRPEVLYEGVALSWILGALLSGSLFLELGWRLRVN